jgi:hypothetical protein
MTEIRTLENEKLFFKKTIVYNPPLNPLKGTYLMSDLLKPPLGAGGKR